MYSAPKPACSSPQHAWKPLKPPGRCCSATVASVLCTASLEPPKNPWALLLVASCALNDTIVPVAVLLLLAGEYKPVSMSTRLLRRLRNPEHALRIPGGDIISNKTSDIIPASAVPVQHSRIPTTVSGRARQVKVSRVTAVPIDDTPTRQQNVTELQAAPRSRYVQEESGNKLNTNHTAANATSMAVATDPVD